MNLSQSIKRSFSKSLLDLKNRRGMIHVIIFVLALVAFEAFNFSTTDFALSDLLGDLRFAGVRWATLLSIAFCGIDFAGIARLFTPQADSDEPRTIWYMFGAWILAATMNAILTWWGVVMAMQIHPVLSATMVDSTFVSRVVPIFIALMVWVIRILLIATLSRKGDKLLHETEDDAPQGLSRREYRQAQSRAAHAAPATRATTAELKTPSTRKPSGKKGGHRPEPTYIPMQSDVAYRSYKASGSSRR